MSTTGTLEIFRDVPSPPERVRRVVRVYLPAAYARAPARRFPVLYLHDGQNVFDAGEPAVAPAWGVDAALDALAAAGATEPWIAVAVDHRGVDRIADYSPWDEPRGGVRGRGRRYGRFVVEHLVPWVDRTYRTAPGPAARAVAGSSLGGLMALYLGAARPDTFGRVAALSPSVMWGGDALADFYARAAARPARVYLDVGAAERFPTPGFVMEYGTAVPAFAARLRALGYDAAALRCVVDPAGEHREADWRRRLPDALRWLLA